MSWKRWIAKGYTLYAAVGFVILIPVMSYHVISEGLPKKILFFVIPGYLVLAWFFYSVFKNIKVK
ncbi:MAG TPA: hypothetical protein VGL89_19240 [Candidatus Koribacter sp.]|jgi:hypothetical protein